MVYSQTRYTSIKSLIHEKIFSEGRGIFGYVVYLSDFWISLTWCF